MKNKLFTALLVLLAVIFVVSAFFVTKYLVESNKRTGEFDELSSFVEQAQKDFAEENGDGSDKEDLARLESYRALHEQNSDMAGWLRVPGTAIDYPVMYTPDDPEFYLRRSFEKEDSRHGTLFIDSRCTVSPQSDNVIIYGHNMQDKSMFAPVLEYKDPEYYLEHKKILFDTLDELSEYEVFAVVLTDVDIWNFEEPDFYSMTTAENAKEFNQFVDMVREASLYETGIVPRYGERIISLSTCEYSTDEGRMVLFAREIKKEE